MDQNQFDRGQAAGLAIASAARNSTGDLLAELVTRELADLNKPGEIATCVGILAKILTQHFNAEVNPDKHSAASGAIVDALRAAFAQEHTHEQLTSAVLAAVSDLNRNELAAVLAAFVTTHYFVDPDGEG